MSLLNRRWGNEEEDEKKRAFMRNGAMLLEMSVRLFNGKCNTIRSFSLDELKNATNNFHPSQIVHEDAAFAPYHCFLLYRDGTFTSYKGILQGRPVILKKYKVLKSPEFSINDVVFSSRMSAHKNVLKLLGCCLETEFPVLVFEYAENGTLRDHIYNPRGKLHLPPLLWKHRLKMAVDVANAVAYLHTAFPRPIIHRGLKPSSIWLDGGYVAKLSNFSFSIFIPEGESHITDDAKGTGGYIAPEYIKNGVFNEKIDVYSFGVVLLALLTGKRAIFEDENNKEHYLPFLVEKNIQSTSLHEIIEPIIVGEGAWPGKEEQLNAFALLALQCTAEIPDDRPEITYVAKQLKKMY